MNRLRNVLGFLMAAIMLAAFASPATAQTKIYSLNVSAYGVSPVAVTIKNETPNGNSTINSFTITPPPGVTVTIANPKSSAPASVVPGPGGTIKVSSFDGLKSGNKTPKTLTVYLNATYNSAPTCASTYKWTAIVYTGNFSSETFTQVVGTTPPTNDTQSPACYTLTYNAGTCVAPISGSPQSVSSGGSGTQVTAVPPDHYHFVSWDDGVGTASRTDTNVAGNITVTASCAIDTFTLTYTAGTGGSITGTSPQTLVPYGGSGTAVTAVPTPNSVYHFDSWSDGVLTASRTDSSVHGNVDATATFASDGTLGCTGGNNGDPVFHEGFVTGFRGEYNKDGSDCVPAAYEVSVDAANKKAALFIDPAQPQAVTSAEIAWPAEFVDPATGLPPSKVTQVAWKFVSGNPDFVPGRYCISPDLPAPYGTLALEIGAGDLTITTENPVLFATVPSASAPIPIVVDTERMNVTGQSGTTLNVARGQGGTTAVLHTTTFLNGTKKPVMSTPFPLDLSNKVMLVCLAAESCQTVSADKCSPLDPTKACTACTSTIFGDWVTSR